MSRKESVYVRLADGTKVLREEYDQAESESSASVDIEESAQTPDDEDLT